MAEASDSPSTPCVQRGNSHPVKSIGRRCALGALASAPAALAATPAIAALEQLTGRASA